MTDSTQISQGSAEKMANSKIKTIEELSSIAMELRQAGKKLVHCHGVFDLLHIGHIRYFEQARRMGDILIVTLTADRFVDKGPHRPAFPEQLRAEAVASLAGVDFVAINEWPTAEETLRCLKPHYYVKGAEFKNISDDRTGKIGKEKQVADELGIILEFADDIVFSSSNLINRYLSHFSEQVDSYLHLLRRRYSLEDVLAVLDRMSALKILVIGDTIIDEYQYCEAIGKSSKDPTLALKYQSSDLFAGGVLAVANHVSHFTRNLDLITVIGEKDSQELFIRQNLRSNIAPTFFIQSHAPTTIKRRFVDGYSFNKLLEIYVMDDGGLDNQQCAALHELLQDRLADYDLVIAADFGHGAIQPATRAILSEKAPFLAINTQANAGNRGFHTISKYTSAHYACIARHELDLEVRNRDGDLRRTIEGLRERMNCLFFTVTLGRNGCAVVSTNDHFVQLPSFSQKIVDRVGAGDAFFAISAMAAVLGVDIELVALIGSVAGSLAVETIGNKKAIDRQSMEKYITALMK